MEKGFRILCLIALAVVAAGCGQPAPEVSTATPVPPTDTPAPTVEPTATEAAPTATAVPPTEAPTATPEPTATVADTPTAPPTQQPVEDAQVLLEERCTVCHLLDRVENARKSREEWESTVDRMIEYGTELTDEERAVLIDYLVANYGS